MIKPRQLDKSEPAPRPTVVIPKPGENFAGWGPRLRY
jgi:hypothetical protein